MTQEEKEELDVGIDEFLGRMAVKPAKGSDPQPGGLVLNVFGGHVTINYAGAPRHSNEQRQEPA